MERERERETDTPEAWSFHWWNIHQVNSFFVWKFMEHTLVSPCVAFVWLVVGY
jgi:hypothetical protein